jgi:hypothetical protein
MKNVVFCDKEKPVRTSQETHYFSTTLSSQLMLCKIWGLHGGDHEECRLLVYKNPVHTSQETHYVSATEPNRFMRFSLRWLWRMPFSGMWHGLALVRTDVSEEYVASIIRLERVGELWRKLPVTSNWSSRRTSTISISSQRASVASYS